jgi:3',5'-cyclic AMP phosphodiesterase CpdA
MFTRPAALALFAVGLLATSAGAQESAPAKYDEKLIHRPSPMPDRIILTWAGNPATSQAVTWRTDTSVTTPVAQLAVAEGGPGFDPTWAKDKDRAAKLPRTVPARSRPLTTALNEALYHRVNFEGLTPRTKYAYRVGDGTNWSEWFQFETPSDARQPFGFIYFGDAQNGIKTLWSRVARGAYSDMPKAKFILHAGDLVNSGSSDTDWGEWHAAAGWINGMVPSVPTPGNHEYTGPNGGITEHWRAQFTLPEHGPPGLGQTCYFLDVQGVRVVSLNSNEMVSEQVPWLEWVLSNNPNRWTVVTFHHPVYSTVAGRDNKHIREAWRPVFDRFGVDLVLQGHDHTYGRTGLMREDNVLSGAFHRGERGTVYAVSVSGAKMYTLGDDFRMHATAQDKQLYQLITIDGDRLRYEARTATGELFDSFVLRKRPDGGNDLLDNGGTGHASGRLYWNAAAGVVILAAVLTALTWAFKRR